MLWLSLFAVLLGYQAIDLPLPPESPPDLGQIISDDAALRSVEVWYFVDDQVVLIRGNGVLIVQSNKQNVQLLPTCEGKIDPSDVRQVLQKMLDVHFLDLPRKSFAMISPSEEEARNLQPLHSITVKAIRGRAMRTFSAGEYGGRIQRIPEGFADLERAILTLRAQAIPQTKPCTVAPSIWSSYAKPVAPTP